MKTKVDEYLLKHDKWTNELSQLRDIMLSLKMEETIKWGSPVYMVDGRNVLGLAAFKNHYGLWFFNGVFLKDNHKLLVNGQEKTKAMRQLKLTKDDELPLKQIREYVIEAIDNERSGKKVVAEKPGAYELSPYLKKALDADKKLLDSFYALTPGKQKDYSNHIADAKQEKTKFARIEKITPMIIAGVGLHDKYKNC